MIAFASMLTKAATEAGMKTPEFTDKDEFDAEQFPHFAVFCSLQLGRPMSSPGVHWDNAKVIAKIPDDRIRTITLGELLDLGFTQ